MLKKLKLGSMKLVIDTVGKSVSKADGKYIGKLHHTSKGYYFSYHGKRVYLPERIQKVISFGKKRKRKTKSSRKKRKTKRKSKKKRKSRKKKRKTKSSRKKRKRKRKKKSKKKRKSRKKKRKTKRKTKSSRKKRRKRKRKSRKKKRKTKSSRKRRKRRKSKKNLKGSQSTKKYMNRPSPPLKANEHCREVAYGNDGRLYRSLPDRNGVCRWKKIPG